MKKLIILSFLLVVSQVAFSQYFLAKNQAQLNAGLGFSSWGLPVYVGFDVGVHRDISVGGELSFRSYNNKFQDNKYRHNIIGFSGNGNYHFNTVLDIPRQWDFYAGLNLGFYYWNSDNDYDGDGSSGLGLGAQVGGRYYFSDKFGINLEFGGGNAFSGGKFGVTLRL
jgi:outer membrane immunogenic protein